MTHSLLESIFSQTHKALAVGDEVEAVIFVQKVSGSRELDILYETRKAYGHVGIVGISQYEAIRAKALMRSNLSYWNQSI